MPDFTGQDVNNWYQQYWGRPAESWEQDYWQQQGLSAGDVQRTLAEAPEAQGQGGGGGGGGGGQTVADFERDYWAPDREEVLAAIHSGQWYGPEWQRPVDLPAPGGGRLGLPGSPVGGWGGGYGGGGAFNESALSQAWLGSGGRTPQDLARFLQQNPQLAQGVTITGSKGDKLRLPNGQIVDAVLASGEGGRGAQWLTEGGGGGGGYGGGGASYGQAPNPTPFVYEQFQRPGDFTFREFEAPTQLTLENDPGYQARLRLGTEALQRSAAAKGTLLTGGTLKDLNQYAQDLASNEFQNVYNRAQQTYGTQYGQAAQDWANNYQRALDAYRTNFETQFKPWEANYQQAYNSWLGNYNAANQGFQNQLAAQNQRYQQLMGAAQLGLQASGQQANYGAGYAGALGNIYGNWGQSAGDLMTGQGNAQAAGQVGGANAWNQFTGNLANMASLYGLSDIYGGGGGGTRSRQPGPWSGGYQF